jgi:hypothetical protein
MYIENSPDRQWRHVDRILNRMAFWIGVLASLFFCLVLFYIFLIIHAIN